MLFLFHTKSPNVWVNISLSGEPLVLHPVCRKDQVEARKHSVRLGLTFLGVGHICTLKTKKYQWSNSFSCTWVLGNHCAGSRGKHSHWTRPDVNAIQRHACMVTNHFWQGACRMSGGVNRPPLFFSWFQRAEKQKQIASPFLPPTSPPNAVKYLHWKHFPEHSPKKDEKAFGNMKDDYGNNSINERVCSMAKLFCDLLVIWGYSNSH